MKNIVSRKTIAEYQEKHPNCKDDLETWYRAVLYADWSCPDDIKKQFPKASILSGNLVIFDIKGGEYRLCVKFAFKRQFAYIKWFGTHLEYDRINKKDGGFIKRFG